MKSTIKRIFEYEAGDYIKTRQRLAYSKSPIYQVLAISVPDGKVRIINDGNIVWLNKEEVTPATIQEIADYKESFHKTIDRIGGFITAEIKNNADVYPSVYCDFLLRASLLNKKYTEDMNALLQEICNYNNKQ